MPRAQDVGDGEARLAGEIDVEHGKVELAFAGELEGGGEPAGDARHFMAHGEEHVIDVHRDQHLVFDDENAQAAFRQATAPWR